MSTGIAVLSDRTSVPSLVRTVPLPAGSQAAGEALTPDGRTLLVAFDAGALAIDVASAEQGLGDPVVGALDSGQNAQAAGAIEVSVSSDGGYAFVSLEWAGAVAVFDLRSRSAGGYGRFVGLIPLGQAVVGTAISPDGRWLYATSEVGAAGAGGDGTLSVIDLARAESDPGHAVVATVNAGCQPVRAVVAADGSVVWVTARASDALLAFSASALRGADSAHALLAVVPVGEAPVGLALVERGRRIVVADSDRFDTPGAHSALSVVDPVAALAGRPALLGSIEAGGFPREMSAEPDGTTLLVTDYSSKQLQTIDLTKLP